MLSMLAAACAFEQEIAKQSEKQTGGREANSPPPELPSEISPLRLHLLSSSFRENFQNSETDRQRSLVCQELLDSLRSAGAGAGAGNIANDSNPSSCPNTNINTNAEKDALTWTALDDKIARRLVLDALRGKIAHTAPVVAAPTGSNDADLQSLLCSEEGLDLNSNHHHQPEPQPEVAPVPSRQDPLHPDQTMPVNDAVASTTTNLPSSSASVLPSSSFLSQSSSMPLNGIYLSSINHINEANPNQEVQLRTLLSSSNVMSQVAENEPYAIANAPTTPTLSDVLCGRGAATNNHPGNLRFRALISLHQRQYLSAQNGEKADISRSVVRALRQLNPPGRFLKKETKTGLWYDIGEDKATEKTSQAFREKKTNSQNPNLILQNIQRVQELVQTDVSTLNLPKPPPKGTNNMNKNKRKRVEPTKQVGLQKNNADESLLPQNDDARVCTISPSDATASV